MIGLKRGIVELAQHESQWASVADQTIQRLKGIYKELAIDIQHVGSTSIKGIKAKPIIDLVIGVKNFQEVYDLVPRLEENGFYHKPENDQVWQIFFSCGNDAIRTHHIHVVIYGEDRWKGYIQFRDYLNAHPDKARQYEALKKQLAATYPEDRQKYTEGKSDFIVQMMEEADRLYNNK
ncbi:GrpB family protein [Peribacillus tepidiphilus]|jgi:GrpB-like predicted nucleotidyltransferase (UPF0157 family)|uniref:GrpB family protein n=1 Tax=Peribacillus tepidiphilus TaxID=2652445 RepID=UPI0012911094|nr:GrpB family protein [Peribacillus tepidiphilus]